MKKKKRATRFKRSSTSPFLYMLPGDLPRVRLIAHTDALEDAWQALLEKVSVDMSTERASMLCVLYERQATIEGQQLTNDIALFRQTYIDVLMERYPESYDALKSGRYTVDPNVPHDARITEFYKYAQDRAKGGKV